MKKSRISLTQAWNHGVGAQCQKQIETPQLDRLVGEGIRFTQFAEGGAARRGFVPRIRDGEAKEECGGGGTGAVGRTQGREGPGQNANTQTAEGERADWGGGAVYCQ